MVETLDEVVFGLNQIRVVTLSKTLIDVDEPDGSRLEGRLEWADARQIVVVTGDRQNLYPALVLSPALRCGMATDQPIARDAVIRKHARAGRGRR